MFEALNAALPQHKYQVGWVELAPVQFQTELPKWIATLAKSAMLLGPQKQQRVALVDEFYRLLHIQKQILTQRGPGSAIEAARADTNIKWFAEACKKQFGAAPKQPGPETALQQLLDRHEVLNGKLELLDEKLQLVNYWLSGTKTFPEHKEGASLLFQYLGNAPTEKVRLMLEVLCSDAEKAVSLKDRATWKTTYGVTVGLQTAGDGRKLSKVEWDNSRFQKAVKGEFGASYGVTAKGACELEFKGLKAKLDGEAFAGARVKAEGSASASLKGVELKGMVEAEVAVKLKGTAAIDCADIFLCEASAEAFAGALAKAECEVTVTVGGVKVKAGAEAFAGAKITGETKATLRIGGYDIVKAEAKASLNAGIGAKAEFEFESSLFSGNKIKIEAGTTFGVGSDVGTTFTTHPENILPALRSLYYAAHLDLLGKKQQRHAWKNYFRGIEDNERLFQKARGVIEQHMATVLQERNRLFTEQQAYKHLEGLASFRKTGAV